MKRCVSSTAVVLLSVCLALEIFYTSSLLFRKAAAERQAQASREKATILRLELERYREEAAIRRRTESLRKLSFKKPVRIGSLVFPHPGGP